MPLPSPRDDETRGQFVQRCMIDESMRSEYPDQPQRYAVCQSIFTDEGKFKAATVTERRVVMMSEPTSIDRKNRTLVCLMTTPVRDRDGDVIDPAGLRWDNFIGSETENPVVLWMHDPKVPPIAKVLEIEITPKGVRALVQFAETKFAQDIFELYAGGFLRAWSIGFENPEGEKMADGEGWHIQGGDIVELSAVSIGANQTALTKSLSPEAPPPPPCCTYFTEAKEMVRQADGVLLLRIDVPGSMEKEWARTAKNIVGSKQQNVFERNSEARRAIGRIEKVEAHDGALDVTMRVNAGIDLEAVRTFALGWSATDHGELRIVEVEAKCQQRQQKDESAEQDIAPDAGTGLNVAHAKNRIDIMRHKFTHIMKENM